MNLTQHTDLGLRVLIYLATHPDDTPTTAAIAEAFAMNEHHATAVAKHLVAQGLVASKRGRAGGLRLARDPASLKVGALVRSLERNLRLVECFDPETSVCPISRACTLRVALEEASDAFFVSLDRYTLADLVANQPRLVRLLKKPR